MRRVEDSELKYKTRSIVRRFVPVRVWQLPLKLGVKTLHVTGAISRLSMYLDLEVDRWTETETYRPILSYPSDVPSLMESLDSGHTTVKTENSQRVCQGDRYDTGPRPGPSTRVVLLEYSTVYGEMADVDL